VRNGWGESGLVYKVLACAARNDVIFIFFNGPDVVPFMKKR